MHENHSATSEWFLLLTPSWLSALITVTASVCFSVIAVLVAEFRNNSFSQYVYAVHTDAHGVGANYQTIANNLDRYQFVGEVCLLAFWAAVGLVVYFFAAHIYNMLAATVDTERELHYKHIKKKEVITQAFLRMVVRCVGLALWVVIVRFTLGKVVGFDFASAKGLADHLSVSSFLQVGLALLATIIDLNLQTICLRLLFDRPRLFSY